MNSALRLLTLAALVVASIAHGQGSQYPADRVRMDAGTNLQQEYDAGSMRAPVRINFDALPVGPPSSPDIRYLVLGDDGTCSGVAGSFTTYCVTDGGTGWEPIGAGGGGGTPGGSNTEIQFNATGSFAGDSDLTFTGGDTLNATAIVAGAIATGGISVTAADGENGWMFDRNTIDPTVSPSASQDFLEVDATGVLTLHSDSETTVIGPHSIEVCPTGALARAGSSKLSHTFAHDVIPTAAWCSNLNNPNVEWDPADGSATFDVRVTTRQLEGTGVPEAVVTSYTPTQIVIDSKGGTTNIFSTYSPDALFTANGALPDTQQQSLHELGYAFGYYEGGVVTIEATDVDLGTAPAGTKLVGQCSVEWVKRRCVDATNGRDGRACRRDLDCGATGASENGRVASVGGVGVQLNATSTTLVAGVFAQPTGTYTPASAMDSTWAQTGSAPEICFQGTNPANRRYQISATISGQRSTGGAASVGSIALGTAAATPVGDGDEFIETTTTWRDAEGTALSISGPVVPQNGHCIAVLVADAAGNDVTVDYATLSVHSIDAAVPRCVLSGAGVWDWGYSFSRADLIGTNRYCLEAE